MEDIEYWEDKLEKVNSIEFLHYIKEYPWGQQSIRIYDLDDYIIEISESMELVINRCLAQELSVEETSEKTM